MSYEVNSKTGEDYSGGILWVGSMNSKGQMCFQVGRVYFRAVIGLSTERINVEANAFIDVGE